MLKQLSLAACSAAIALMGSAYASTVTTYNFSGQAQGGSASASTTSLPVGGVLRADDPRFNYSVAVGAGTTNPINFAAGAAAAGDKASASSNLTVTIQITNDTGVASTATMGALIYAGGVGIANPNFNSATCTTAAIEACGSFLPGSSSVGAGDMASLSFSAALDGTELYGGAISVDSAAKVANFSSGFGLTGFGVDPINSNLFSWQDTTLSGIDLGVFAVGETKTLTFLVAAKAATSTLLCRVAINSCPIALAGFGDPPPGNGGVIITSQFAALMAPSFTFAFRPAPPVEVPLPPAALLFGGGLAMLGAARRRRRAK